MAANYGKGSELSPLLLIGLFFGRLGRQQTLQNVFSLVGVGGAGGVDQRRRGSLLFGLDRSEDSKTF